MIRFNNISSNKKKKKKLGPATSDEIKTLWIKTHVDNG
jgi:hypothetical protein